MSRVIRPSLCVVLTVMVLLAASGALAQQAAPAPPPAAGAPAASPPARRAGAAAKVDTGDTAWVLTSSALVLMMTAPGLALFYGGMVRRKNVLRRSCTVFILMAVISVQWVLFGYSLAFGPDVGGIVGSLEWVGLRGVGVEPNADYAATIPHQAFMVFQLMFAIITPALITGAFAERMKFSAFLLFTLLWATFVYDPLAPLGLGRSAAGSAELGALDFAGGTVVHISVGRLRARRRAGHRPAEGLRRRSRCRPTTCRSPSSGRPALGRLVRLQRRQRARRRTASRRAPSSRRTPRPPRPTLAWMFAEWGTRGKPTVLGAASGAVAGLVAITPASGFVGPISAILIGLGGGVLCFFGLQPQVEARVRRQPRRRRRPRHRRDLGRARHRPLRLQGDQRGRRRRPLLRQSGPALLAARGRGGHMGLRLRGLRDPPQDRRRRGRAASDRAGGVRGLDLSQHSETRTPSRAATAAWPRTSNRWSGASPRRPSHRVDLQGRRAAPEPGRRGNPAAEVRPGPSGARSRAPGQRTYATTKIPTIARTSPSRATAPSRKPSQAPSPARPACRTSRRRSARREGKPRNGPTSRPGSRRRGRRACPPRRRGRRRAGPEVLRPPRSPRDRARG